MRDNLRSTTMYCLYHTTNSGHISSKSHTHMEHTCSMLDTDQMYPHTRARVNRIVPLIMTPPYPLLTTQNQGPPSRFCRCARVISVSIAHAHTRFSRRSRLDQKERAKCARIALFLAQALVTDAMRCAPPANDVYSVREHTSSRARGPFRV